MPQRLCTSFAGVDGCGEKLGLELGVVAIWWGVGANACIIFGLQSDFHMDQPMGQPNPNEA